MRRASRICARIGVAIIAALFIACVIGRSVAATPTKDAASLADDQAKLTLMVYMAGSNLESEGGAASADLEEMRRAIPSDGSLRIIVMASGARQWHCDVALDVTNIYEMTPDGLQVLEEGPLASMGDQNTLLRLLAYTYEKCPAKRYALVLWDHGAGPMMGTCFDELFAQGDGMDGLTMQELCHALGKSPFAQKQLDWIGFDACMMASLETTYALGPYANYLVASQEPEPQEGWDYGFLRTLASKETVEGMRDILDAYEDSTKDTTQSVTLSCTDLARIPPLVKEITAIVKDADITQESFATYASCRSSARRIGDSIPYDYDLVDLHDFLQSLDEANLVGGKAACKHIEEAVVYNYASRSRHCGLSIYFPYKNKARYVSPWSSYSRALIDTTGFQRFLRDYASIWMGESIASWNSMHTPEADDENQNRIMLQLNQEQASQLDTVRMVVVSQKGPGLYSFVYANDAVDITPQGMLYAEYHHEGLYFVDKDGVPQTGALSFNREGDYIYLSAKLYRYKSAAMKRVRMVYRKNNDGRCTLENILEEDESGQLAGKTSLRLKDWDTVSLENCARTRSVSPDGQCSAFDEWSYGSMVFGYEIKTKDIGTLEFLHLQDDDRHFAFFEMTDYQGFTASSELVPLPNESRLPIETTTKTLVDSQTITMSLDEATMVVGAEPSLQLDYSVTNHTGQSIAVRISKYRFDGTTYDWGFFGGRCYVVPKEKTTARIFMDAEDLRRIGITRIEELSFTVSVYRSDNAYDANAHIIEEHEVSIPLHVDLSAFG